MPGLTGLSALTEAATALLGESSDICDHRQARSDSKRTPPVNTPTIVPETEPERKSFPEMLMALACQISNDDVITFLPDGKFFAIRVDEFSSTVMSQHFHVESFDDFLSILDEWGFHRVLSPQESSLQGIEVIRHPLFRQDDWELCARIKAKTASSPERKSPHAQNLSIQRSYSEDHSAESAGSQNKRRLSPGYMARRASETNALPLKQRNHSLCDIASIPDLEKTRSDSSDAEDAHHSPSLDACSGSEDLHEIALAVTTQKLNIRSRSESPEDAQSLKVKGSGKHKLVDRAVESATQSIVTDAIETLLKDEPHSRKTFHKHKEVLSKSTIPGLIPISQQLFATPSEVAPPKTMTHVVSKTESPTPPSPNTHCSKETSLPL